MENSKVRFGIVGCGLISKWHINALGEIPGSELIGVYDQNKSIAETKAAECGCRVFETYEDMLSCADIDVVTICTPSGLHASLAVSAAEAKKHIIVEKPMAITKEQIDDLVEACEINNVKVCVISQLRFTKAVQFVKRAIDDGALGEILIATLNMKYHRDADYYLDKPWRGTWALDGGGALMNQGIHGVDLLSYLLGPVKSVFGKAQTKVHKIETDDTTVAYVDYVNGAMGTINATTSVNPGYPRTLEINGTKGTVILEEDRVKSWDVEGYDIPDDVLSTEEEYVSHNSPGDFTTIYHKMQILDMIKAIVEDKQPLINMYEGKKTVEIILGIYESSKTGKKVDIN